jgi:hypothetical protein
MENIIHNLLNNSMLRTLTVIFKIITILFGTCFVIVNDLSAQETNVSNYYFQSDTLTLSYGRTFSNILRFENKTTLPVKYFKKSVTAGALLTLPDSVILAPGTVQNFPVKYFSSPESIKSALQEFVAEYISPNQPISKKAVFYTRVNAENRVLISAVEPVVYLNNNSKNVSLKIRLINNGYAPVTLKLKFTTYPAGLQISNSGQLISLVAGADQLLQFEATNLNVGNFAPDYNVTIEGIDASGQALTTGMLRVVSLGSNKLQASGPASYSGMLNNSTELNYMSLNKDYSFYGLRTNGNFRSSDSTGLSYNANLNYYNKGNGIDVFDTWVNYATKSYAVTAGNINDNLDFSLYGRGIKASAFIDKKNSIDVYGVQNKYLLISQSSNQPDAANIYAASYNYENSLFNNAKVSVIYSDDPVTKVRTRLVNGFAQVKLSGFQRLEFKGGYSFESNGQLRKPGYASGLNYFNRLKKWEFSSNNYYSSAYYSGLQRGLAQFDERVSYDVHQKATVFLHYNYLNTTPSYLSTYYNISGFNNKVVSYETGISTMIGRVSLGWKPYLLKQDIQLPLFNTPGLIQSSSSIRMALDMSYSIHNYQFTFLGDYGFTRNQSEEGGSKNQGLRINTSVSSRWWNFSALIQTAPYYLTENISFSNSTKPYRAYSFGPGIRFKALQDRLSVFANNYLNYISTSQSGWNNSFNTQLKYHLKSTWQISGQMSYNSNTYFPQNYSLQTQVGVIKQFAQNTSPGNAKLELTFYGDDNANGVRDKNEKTVGGIITDLHPDGNANASSTLSTISNDKGRVSYANLKKDIYNLDLTKGGSWYMGPSRKLVVSKSQKIEIPLTKSGWLKGQVTALKQDYLNSKPDLEGLKIIATDGNNQSFYTYTNDAGEFNFPLPLNKYTIIADIDVHKFSVVKPSFQVIVNQSSNNDVNFQLIDLSRKAIVTQF